jgi:predicted nucleic acid-binding protein
LLQKLYRKVTVPLAVTSELEVGTKQGIDVPKIDAIEWIQVRSVASAVLVPAVIDLGQGEAEVLALGLEIPNSLLIFDDKLARRIADLYHLKYTGTLGILVKAKQLGYLASVAPVISQLQSQGMWLDAHIINDVLRLCNEEKP